jgi:DNA-binding HxlR family transcriptional regulator
MKGEASTPETVCPVAQAVSIVGDRWTILILRELSSGASRFEEIQIQTGSTPQMLATRMKALEQDGMVERKPYSRHPLRYEYHLTEKGCAFYPVIYAMRAWGETWCKPPGQGFAVQFKHKACGNDVGLESFCHHCGVPVERKDLESHTSPAFLKEREIRREDFRNRKD